MRFRTFVLALCSGNLPIASCFASLTSNVISRTSGSAAFQAPWHRTNALHCRDIALLHQKSSLSSHKSNKADSSIIGTVTLLVPSSSSETSPFGSKSPVSRPSWHLAAQQLARKIRQFSDGTISTRIVTPQETEDDACLESNALVALGLTSPSDIQYLSKTFRKRRSRQQEGTCQFAVSCGSNNYAPIVGPYDEANPSILATFAPWTNIASGKRLATQMTGLFEKNTSDEFALAIMLFFNQFSGSKIPWVQHSIDVTWEKGLFQNSKEIYGMITKCGPCIARCLNDENCSSCLKALDKIDTRDQVNSYRTVVSYESELLRDFSLCILQKNNIFECKAEIPSIPYVKPIDTWRGNQVTTEIARGIMIGHLAGVNESLEGNLNLDVSWKVACGANVAYDQFPSQNQLFYPDSKGKDLWYDPVFRVETIDGRNVWCKRHYKVRNGKVPGTFRFSVLDNGVTSNEFWTIVDAADDLSWVVFHYAGAAGAVGQRYLGGLLCTPDGKLPHEEAELERIWKVLRSAEIEPWELFVVDNDEQSTGALVAGPPPLDYYRKVASVVG
ncbi:hypothetical protein HJC23_000521 [Cyclotella cryptica]|uniref:VDE lipocalin domain-containing protein n=1 Tax=Cyclotella cryptica TaxID=29204 RepID=A0ABD3NUD5_9STRA|eukprot:CCRYP_019660-RA/>CCRYP_019660-RA protein AED:0.34 eAED:0.34 QI:238/1/1/1/0.57/0.37/8/653/556